MEFWGLNLSWDVGIFKNRLRVSQVAGLVFGSPIFDMLDFNTFWASLDFFHTPLPDCFFSIDAETSKF